MKAFIAIIVFVCFGFFNPKDGLFAQRNKNKEEIVLITNGEWKNDTYRDKRRSLVYQMDELGGVKDKKGNDIIIVIGNSYRDWDNNMIGRFYPNGEVRNASGRKIGNITFGGHVLDWQEKHIDDYGELTREQAAVQYFFWELLVHGQKHF